MPLLQEEFDRLVSIAGDPQTTSRVVYRCKRFFRGLNLEGKTLLEIGAGNGILGAYAMSQGAKRVVALEPESAGSTAGVSRLVQRLSSELPPEQFTFLPSTFQEYDPAGVTFDMVLLHDSINHLDEPACEIAHRSKDARQTYIGLFQKIASLLSPGGQVVICDCSRYNLFGLCRMRSPVVPFIEWHKHQTPRFWAHLLKQAGLRTRKIDWYTLYPLRRLGRLMENPVAAMFLNSKFRLIAQA